METPIDTSLYTHKNGTYAVNYDILLPLGYAEQKSYLAGLKLLNAKPIKEVVNVITPETLRFTDFKGGGKFGFMHKVKNYVDFIEGKINAGVVYCEATLKDLERYKKLLDEQKY